MSIDRFKAHVDIAAALKNRRVELGLTQRQLADRLNTGYSAVSRFESGNYERHSIREIGKYCEALNMNFEITFSPTQPKQVETLVQKEGESDNPL